MNKVTEEGVQNAIQSFVREAARATGKDGQRARFRSFRIVDGLKAVVDEAIKSFAEGDFGKAAEKIRNAKQWLRNAERKYCLNSLEGFFAPQIEELEGQVDQDIMDSVRSKKKEFELALIELQSSFDADLDKASGFYWGLLDAVEEAPKTQKARDEHRARLASEERSRKQREKIAAQNKKDEEGAEKSRKAQAEADARRREQRANTARSLADQLSSL